MGPALPVGHEGLSEIFDVECTAPVRQSHLEAMARLLPTGMELLDARDLVPGAPSLGKMVAAARYRVPQLDQRPWPNASDEIPETLREGISLWEVLPSGDLRIELNQRESDGPVVSVKALLAALGLDDEHIRRVRVTRERLVLRPRSTVEHRTQPKGETAASGTGGGS